MNSKYKSVSQSTGQEATPEDLKLLVAEWITYPPLPGNDTILGQLLDLVNQLICDLKGRLAAVDEFRQWGNSAEHREQPIPISPNLITRLDRILPYVSGFDRSMWSDF